VALVGGGTSSSDCLRLVVGLVDTLLPEMERLGIATAADVDFETLAERMTQEAIGSSSVIFGHWQMAAWSRV
jgi:hypothetical protein